ncbi:MAG: phosphoribosylglycinamide formyltransferase [Deltaproteobacteria bacterium]|nr:phosphoribosylglycinamide formyltransferase [Deltaproteobacteria bacterium]
MTHQSKDSMLPAKLAIAVSGGGRSLANFIARSQSVSEFQVAAVIASTPNCRGVSIAREHGIPVFVGDFVKDADVTAHALEEWLLSQNIDWIVLAGFIKRFPVLKPWQHRLINIHPALLPEFGGKGMYGDRVHAAVLAAGRDVSGATVHFVNDHYDEGAIIAQAVVPVLPSDDTHSLADRVFAAECKLYPEVMRRLINGTLPLPSGAIERYNHERL